MYRINQKTNRIEALKKETFTQLSFKERNHLQEWLCHSPEALGEDLLIIQKEFSGFDGTRERLDLLALDKEGDLVVIENKLDDSGKDVTWQALKYASYCSKLTKDQICDIYQEYLKKIEVGAKAEERISEFFEGREYEELLLNQGSKQRIILVAGRFQKEVTSTVLWLMNYGLRIQCFRVSPFSNGQDELFLNVEQILPVADTEELSISIKEKVQDEIAAQESNKTRHKIRLEFWAQFLQYANQHTLIFQNCSPSKDNWIGIGLGTTGISADLAVSRKYAKVQVYINQGDKVRNKEIFEYFFQRKEELEKEVGLGALGWERKEENVTSYIKYEDNQYNVFDTSQWPAINKFLLHAAGKIEPVFRKAVMDLKH